MIRKTQGFTLIEIMVVVTIAAILMGAVVLSFPNKDDDLLKENAARLTALVALAQDEAILQSRDLALAINDEGYQFYRRQGDAWEVFSDGPFKPRKLKGLIHSDLYLEGVAIKLKKQAKTKPQILISTSGEMTPFTYFLGDPDKSNITIKVNAVGTIEQVFKEADFQ